MRKNRGITMQHCCSRKRVSERVSKRYVLDVAAASMLIRGEVVGGGSSLVGARALYNAMGATRKSGRLALFAKIADYPTQKFEISSRDVPELHFAF